MNARRHPNHRPAATLPIELRRTSVPLPVQAWVSDQLGAAVETWRRLPGASTSAVHRLRLVDGRTVVLRRYVWQWVLEDEPDVFPREVEALRFAYSHGLPVPEVLAGDADGSAIGDGIPALVTSFVPGHAVAVPDLTDLAAVAISIHEIDASAFPYEYAPWYTGAITDAPQGATDPPLWRRALEIWHSQLPHGQHGFLHRDFHPGNVLWRRRRPHIVDWASGCRGPAGCDVAHCRDNLIFLGGFDVADEFLRLYTHLSGEEYDPFWEIASVLEHSKFPPERIAVSERRLRPAVASYR